MPDRIRRLVTFLAAPGLALSLTACSFGISSIVPDASETTGAIPKLEIARQPLGQEDTRRANGALALALDPQGSGAPVNWDNPDTNVKGTIAPRGQPFVRADEICRHFKVTLSTGAKKVARDGTACRVTADGWDIRYLGFPRTAS